MCNRLGVDAGDRLALDSRKRKFLIKHLPDTDVSVCVYASSLYKIIGLSSWNKTDNDGLP